MQMWYTAKSQILQIYEFIYSIKFYLKVTLCCLLVNDSFLYCSLKYFNTIKRVTYLGLKTDVIKSVIYSEEYTCNLLSNILQKETIANLNDYSRFCVYHHESRILRSDLTERIFFSYRIDFSSAISSESIDFTFLPIVRSSVG